MTTFFLCLIIGIILGRIGLLGMIIDSIIMWYQDKYGEFTPGDGRNYLQIFKTSIEVK